MSHSVPASSHAYSIATTISEPRKFPSSGFEIIDPSDKVEEERLAFYNQDDYYPMRIGQVILGRYQIVAKCDLREQKYWALKVHINGLKRNQELEVYHHLAGVELEDPLGQEYVRELDSSFKLKGPHDLVVSALNQVLLGLRYLHEAGVVHTDLHSDNLLIALTDDSILSTVEENEIHKPSPRKQIGDTVIQVSQYVLGGAGALTISDLGQARIGGEHQGNAMPVPYRAPEVILNMPWGSSVDAWSIGLLAWDLLEKEKLFRVYDRDSREKNDACHLAAMTALLGPPPPEFLKRSKETSIYWNEDGQWKGPVPLPSHGNLESLVSSLVGEEKDLFLNFVQCFLCWLPEERLTALQGYCHPWLRGKDWWIATSRGTRYRKDQCVEGICLTG